MVLLVAHISELRFRTQCTLETKVCDLIDSQTSCINSLSSNLEWVSRVIYKNQIMNKITQKSYKNMPILFKKYVNIKNKMVGYTEIGI